MPLAPAPLEKAPRRRLAAALGICFDIDDTFTTEGRIRPEAFAALWRGAEAGLAMIPVTGRPAGWCDHICRMWPVEGIVGENGAFYFAWDRARRRVVRRWARPAARRAADRARLAELADEIVGEVKGARVAADQPYREADLAIDFAEDVGPLPDAAVSRIVALLEARGATAKVSSIHVNGWFGRWDKRTMLLRLARERLGLEAAAAARRLVYVGDSPNDAPLFGAFDLSFGVANVRRFLPELVHPPRWIAPSEGSLGFAEVVDAVLQARR